MFRRIALSAGGSFLAVTTIIAAYDYFRILYRPVIATEWHLHYALLVSTPIDATMLAYGQAVLDYLLSPVPAFATVLGAVLLLLLQVLASEPRDHLPRRLLDRVRARAAAFSIVRSRTA